MSVVKLSVFSQDKQAFLAQKKKYTFDEVKTRAKQKLHSFLLEHLFELQQEFNTLYQTLQQHKEQRLNFLCYAQYCALLLEQYHRQYGQEAKARELKKKVNHLQELIDNLDNQAPLTQIGQAKEKSFFQKLAALIGAGLDDAQNTLRQASNARSKVVLINMLRMMYMVARMAWMNFLVVLNNHHLLERLSEFFKQDLSLDVLQKRLNSIQSVANILSVALFLMRAAINSAMLLKHVFFPSDGEEKSTHWQRLVFELNKRHGDLLNDVVWAGINLITNFPMILALNFPAIIAITVAFMLFDLGLILWLWHREAAQFQNKIEQFSLQIAQLTGLESLDETQTFELNILMQQQRLLMIDNQAMQAKWQINAAAATLLAGSFASAFLMAVPIATVACLLLAAVAVSLYLSAGHYAEMVKKKEQYQLAKLEGNTEPQALAEYRQAQQSFALNLLKFSLAPALIMGTMVVCWQAALAVTLAYGAWQLIQALSTSAPVEEDSQTPSVSPLKAA
ncbi:MAG: hypothetical protein JJT82_09410 [Legionellaceae bacterium]|nr:hypothetical protein [Legionellaceae bacterium]